MQRGEIMGELYNPYPKLPKNIRQIGERDQVVKLYIEDYVNTYLKRLYPAGNQTMRAGLLLGTTEQHDGTPYIFVDGALEMEEIETEGEKISFSDSAWKKAYQAMEEAFPNRTIQGWFLCGSPSSQLSPLNYWKQHIQYFSGKNQLMYLNHGLEGEEAVYVTSEDGFYRLKGHCIYYERNQLMQDYMITRKDVHRVETGSHETVIKDFRQRMSVKKEEAMLHHRKTSFLGMVCGSLSVAILAGGVVLVNNYAKMQKMESVLTSVLPQGMSGWSEYAEKMANEPDFIIEEIKGNVYPTEASQAAAESGSGGASGTESSISGSGEATEGTPGMAEAAAGSSETGSGEMTTGSQGWKHRIRERPGRQHQRQKRLQNRRNWKRPDRDHPWQEHRRRKPDRERPQEPVLRSRARALSVLAKEAVFMRSAPEKLFMEYAGRSMVISPSLEKSAA